MANQFLALSLFLMLLSFFIVMNSVSGYEDSKKQPVLNSVALAFSTEVKATEQATSQEENPAKNINQGNALDRLEGLFETHISGFQASRDRFGTTLYVRVPIISFEHNLDLPVIKESADRPFGRDGSFLQTMISLLVSGQDGKHYRMEITLNIPEAADVYMLGNNAAYLQDIKKLGRYADKLERAGLPKKMLSVGMKKGETGFVELFFYPYAPYSPVARKEVAE